MVDVKGDILEDIPDDDLPMLAKIYEKHQDWYPQGYSIINTGIEWKRKGTSLLKFFSPNMSWKDDGTFFVILSTEDSDMYNIYSLDKSGERVYDAITKTNRIITDNPVKHNLLYCIPDNLYPAVARAIKDRKFANVCEESRCDMYAISKEKALQYDTTCPPELYMKSLAQKHAFQVNAVWPHRTKNSESYISLLIEMNESYGLFLKSSDELVSWALLSVLGQLTVVQTADKYMRNGYGSLITKAAAKGIAKKGYNVIGTILKTNTQSQKMFEKLGFKNIGPCIYTQFT